MTFDLSTLSIILQSIAVAVVIVLAVFAWRWLRVALEREQATTEREQISAQNEALKLLATYAKRFVGAAEQVLAKQPGMVKLDWVLAQFEVVLPDVDKALIRSFVEDFVRELDKPAPPKPLTLAPAPTTTFTSGSTGYMDGPPAPPPPAACDDLAPQPQPPATSHSHKDRGKSKTAQTV